MIVSAMILLGVGIGVGAAYTRYVVGRADDQLWAWLHNLVAAVVSLLLALSTGFVVYAVQHQYQAAVEFAQT
ncbi:MAG TPA: hypothetical protein VHL59_09525, partial [Thermoanaerobaculia bacterium]|nr:hypothetical protein [Thermoanaerobaculia bacterium]